MERRHRIPLNLMTILKCWIKIIILWALNPLSFASSLTIADKIQFKIESNLYKFEPYVQSHYATRMYRLSGNSKYLYPILFNQLTASIQYKHLVEKITWNRSLPDNYRISVFNNFKMMKKWDKRRYILNSFPDVKVALKLVYILSTASKLNLVETSLYPNSKDVINYLKNNKKQLKRFLLTPIFIKYASPSLANHVYNLKEMKIIDITDEFQGAFQLVFNDQHDDVLSNAEYTEKIYGMTHIIIAASNYYQNKVSKKAYNWIYTYFDAHIDEIISRLKYDVIIEVGLCYLLADKANNSQPIEKIKNYARSRFNPKTNLITEPWDKNRIEKAEHRNVLTVLFLKWASDLHPGPNLLNSKQFKVLMQPQTRL